jgi:uncharacterized protein (DUF927 family)
MYCAVAIKGGKVKPSFHGTIADVDAAAQAAGSKGADAYFALASFDDPALGRTAANAVYLRCFFLDLDVGPNKPYATQADAAKDLRQFINTTGLPLPTIVNSGGGLHVYWPLTEDVPAQDWVEHAKRLKSLCKQHNLGADPAVTADAARILRVPGTQNFKEAFPRPVLMVYQGQPVALDDILKALPTGTVVAASSIFAAKQFGTDDVTKDLAAEDHPPSEFAKIVRLSVKGNGCAQMAHAVQNAATLEEPLWRGVLSIAVRCVDGGQAIHKVSKAHPGYNPAATEKKASETKGPYTCDWYRTNNPAQCKGCKQQISSPIVLGKIVQESTPVNDAYVVEVSTEGDEDPDAKVTVEIPAYPFPYFRGANGGVFKRTVVDQETIDIEVYPSDLYITGRFFDSDLHGDGDGELVGINLHMRKDGVRRFHAKVTDLFAKDSLRDLLNKNGAIAYGKQLDILMAYFASSIRKLQSQYAASKTRSQMGWTPDMQGFVVGELEYTPDGTKLAPPASGIRQLAPAFVPRGSLDAWKEMANFYNTPGLEPHALAFFFGFGSPLLKFIGGEAVKGALIHLKSNESGSGKTTVQMMVNSIFGHPSELLMTKDDTYAAKMHRIGLLNSIAYTVDEITNAEDKELSSMAYGFTTGRDRHRMESQTNRLRTNNTTWNAITITSSNGSMIDKLAQLKSTADGELKRTLEIEVPRLRNVAKADVDRLFGQLTENYGVAGPVFIKYVVSNQQLVLAALKDMQAKIDAALSLEQNDRFYSCVLACAFVAALIARKLGLFDIEINRIYNYALEVVRQNKALQISSVGGPTVVAQETLSSFINENVANALVINSPVKGAMPTAPIVSPRNVLRMRYEPDTKELFITVADFRAHFTKKQVDVRESIRALTAINVIKHNGTAVAKRIGAGAVGGLSGLCIRCYVIDGTALGIDETSFTSNEDDAQDQSQATGQAA